VCHASNLVLEISKQDKIWGGGQFAFKYILLSVVVVRVDRVSLAGCRRCVLFGSVANKNPALNRRVRQKTDQQPGSGRGGQSSWAERA